MQYISKGLYIEDNELVISLRERKVKYFRQHCPVDSYIQGSIERNLYEGEEQDRHVFDDQHEDTKNRYIVYLPRDKQKSSIERITPYYHEIDNWNIPTRCKKNAKIILQKLGVIINHGFYAELQDNYTMVCYLNIGRGIILSIDNPLYLSVSNVVYSITYKSKILRVNFDDIDTLIRNIIQLQKKLKFIA